MKHWVILWVGGVDSIPPQYLNKEFLSFKAQVELPTMEYLIPQATWVLDPTIQEKV